MSGLVVAELARERLLVEVDDPMVNLQCLVGLELLAASLAHVDLRKCVILPEGSVWLTRVFISNGSGGEDSKTVERQRDCVC